MKESNYNKDIIGYALSFVSFIFPKLEDVREIILFGSVAREEAGNGSDVDLFINIENKNRESEIKKIIQFELSKFYKSKIAEVWFNKGIKNEIKVQVGNLEEWKLKRSIISDGIILFSKYKETPEKLGAYVYFNINPIGEIAKRNKILRKLFGRKEKGYGGKGLVEELTGKRQSLWSFFVPSETAKNIQKFLNNEKVSYRFFEIWTDQIN
ncbi:MAG: nucleotidyltransferase domain-containing protein [archaeon]|nr:nucleotidyltransferase domain-containing protein [archaeon]